MAAMLGADGTMKGTFVSFMKAKQSLTVELLRGDSVSGMVVGAPADDFVVIDRQWTSSSGNLLRQQFLVRYEAIVTITEGPIRPEERAAG